MKWTPDAKIVRKDICIKKNFVHFLLYRQQLIYRWNNKQLIIITVIFKEAILEQNKSPLINILEGRNL